MFTLLSNGNNAPLVTVIVPNYNHAKYLERRLESIYEQTYTNFEVILMDDCSSDGSQSILKLYRDRFSHKTKLIQNSSNSGGVFHQWKKGLALASGELIWIAESDDYCSPDFLENLVGYFSDESIKLAYCRTDFVNNDEAKIWSIEEYLQDIDKDLWAGGFIRPASSIVKSAWAIKNIVPNVSSAVFRKPMGLTLLGDEDWASMRICGDWVFYLHLIRGGQVAFTTKSTNYYRIHSTNTSVSTYSKDAYYKEHEVVARELSHLYAIDSSSLAQMEMNIKRHWIENRADYSEEKFSECFNLGRCDEKAIKRRPNVLMVGYSFSAGGGETFPIQLANILYRAGYSVTFLNCHQEPRVHRIRALLNPDIAIVDNFYALESIVEEFDIEIIHSHHAWVDNTILDLLPETSVVKTIVSLHGMYETISNEDLKRLMPRLIKRTAMFVYTADKNLEPFARLNYLNQEQFKKIGNALDYFEITPIDYCSYGIPSDAFVVCLVSRAIPEKGWAEAVEIVSLAREKSGRDIHLILIGEGPEYSRLKKTGVPEYIHLLGFRGNIRDYYAASDIGFLPSRFHGESFPLTIIDCLMSGKPVLASGVGEIRSMLSDTDLCAGWVFELENWVIDLDGVASILAEISEKSAAYTEALEGVSSIVRKFDPGVMARKYQDVYCSVTDC